MKINILTIAIISLIAIVGCQKNERNPAFIGNWKGTEWLIADKPSDIDASQVTFEFKADGAYHAAFGNQSQKGQWRSEDDKLYTTETGKKEIMVKVLKLDASSLDFEMNRGGQKETLKLKKNDGQ